MTIPRLLIAAAAVWGLAAGSASAHPPAHAASAASPNFGTQVRAIAQGEREDEAHGIGRTVSEMAHDRNAARADARVTATILDDKQSRGRGRKAPR